MARGDVKWWLIGVLASAVFALGGLGYRSFEQRMTTAETMIHMLEKQQLSTSLVFERDIANIRREVEYIRNSINVQEQTVMQNQRKLDEILRLMGRGRVGQ